MEMETVEEGSTELVEEAAKKYNASPKGQINGIKAPSSSLWGIFS